MAKRDSERFRVVARSVGVEGTVDHSIINYDQEYTSPPLYAPQWASRKGILWTYHVKLIKYESQLSITLNTGNHVQPHPLYGRGFPTTFPSSTLVCRPSSIRPNQINNLDSVRRVRIIGELYPLLQRPVNGS